MVEYPRTIYVVRHCEREDNINNRWQKIKGNEDFRHDNSPLSERGRQQAKELQKHFADIKIDYVFASPFDRTIETAHNIARGKEPALRVMPEPGLCEVLYLCEKPPSFWEPEKLVERFDSVDVAYLPVFTKNTLPREGFGDDGCCDRVSRALERLLMHDGTIMLVSHGAAIGAIHQALIGDFVYVGQATISKFTEVERGIFKLEYGNDAQHLSDRSNLRPCIYPIEPRPFYPLQIKLPDPLR